MLPGNEQNNFGGLHNTFYTYGQAICRILNHRLHHGVLHSQGRKLSDMTIRLQKIGGLIETQMPVFTEPQDAYVNTTSFIYGLLNALTGIFYVVCFAVKSDKPIR